MGQSDTVRFRHKTEKTTVAVKTPRSSLLDNLKTQFVVTVKQLVRDSPTGIFVCEFESLRTEPLHIYNRDEGVGQDAAHRCIWCEVFEFKHA